MTEPHASFVASLQGLHAESVRYWEALPTREFFAPIGDAWSPATNVRHLTKSMRAVTKGLRLPRLLLRLMFGGAAGASRSYEETREAYRARLARGASAGRFTPGAMVPGGDTEPERERIMTQHATAVATLCGAAMRWSDPDLDRLRLPHPLLGPLTVREMLHFTLYHNRHHLENVKRRLATSRVS